MIRNANHCAYASFVASKCALRGEEKRKDYCAAAAKLRDECRRGKLVHFGCSTSSRAVDHEGRRKMKYDRIYETHASVHRESKK